MAPLLAPLVLAALLGAVDSERRFVAAPRRQAAVGSHGVARPHGGVAETHAASRPVHVGARRALSSAALLALAGLPRSFAGNLYDDEPIGKDDFHAMIGKMVEERGEGSAVHAISGWWEELWEKADVNGDGYLTTPELEFFALLSEESALVAKERATEEGVPLELVFEKVETTLRYLPELDVDGDGRYNEEELRAGATRIIAHSIGLEDHTKVHAVYLPVVERAWPRADIDQDGSLDEGEAEFLMYLVRQGMLEMGSDKEAAGEEAAAEEAPAQDAAGGVRSAMDMNGNGRLDLDDLSMALESGAEEEDAEEVGQGVMGLLWGHFGFGGDDSKGSQARDLLSGVDAGGQL